MKKIRKLILGLIIAAAALYYTLQHVSLRALFRSFLEMELVYLIPVVGLTVLSYFIHVLRWKVLISPIKSLPLSGLYSPLMVGYLGNLLPARAGDVLRAYLLGQRFNISFSSALATIVAERMFDLIMILVMFCWVLVAYSGVMNSDLQVGGFALQSLAIKFGQIMGGMLVVLLVLVYLLIRHPAALRSLVRWLTRPLPQKWTQKMEFWVQEFRLGFMGIQSSSALIQIVFYSVLELGVNVFSFYPLFWAYNLDNKSLEALLIVVAMLSIALITLPTPAFLGSFNAGIFIGLHEIMGESELAAVSFGMVAWTLNFLVVFLAGVYFILHDHLSVRTLVEVETKGARELQRLE